MSSRHCSRDARMPCPTSSSCLRSQLRLRRRRPQAPDHLHGRRPQLRVEPEAVADERPGALGDVRGKPQGLPAGQQRLPAGWRAAAAEVRCHCFRERTTARRTGSRQKHYSQQGTGCAPRGRGAPAGWRSPKAQPPGRTRRTPPCASARRGPRAPPGGEPAGAPGHSALAGARGAGKEAGGFAQRCV